MRSPRAGVVLAVLALLVAAGCGSKAHGPEHGAAVAPVSPVVPTPDYTPIQILRTPAGLVLGTEEHAPPTPTPRPEEVTPEPAITRAPA